MKFSYNQISWCRKRFQVNIHLICILMCVYASVCICFFILMSQMNAIAWQRHRYQFNFYPATETRNITRWQQTTYHLALFSLSSLQFIQQRQFGTPCWQLVYRHILRLNIVHSQNILWLENVQFKKENEILPVKKEKKIK